MSRRKWRFFERGDGDSSEQREGGWRKGESVLGFVGAGSEGPQGGQWGMVRDDGILVCRVPPPTPPPFSNIIIPLYCELASSIFCPQCQTMNGDVCMRALSLRSARCHVLKQGAPFMHSR